MKIEKQKAIESVLKTPASRIRYHDNTVAIVSQVFAVTDDKYYCGRLNANHFIIRCAEKKG